MGPKVILNKNRDTISLTSFPVKGKLRLKLEFILMKKIALISIAVSAASLSSAAPLFVQLADGPHFNVGAWNQTGATPWGGAPGSGFEGIEWATAGVAPDRLFFTPSGNAQDSDNEVTAFWPNWWNNAPTAIFGADGNFGGDFVLNLAWFNQDAPYVGGPSTIDVSLNGFGVSEEGGPAPLQIWGRVGSSTAPMQLLWAQTVDVASLYGYSANSSFVMEGLGTVVAGVLAQPVLGKTGGFRGYVDFWANANQPSAWMPPLYNPIGNANVPGTRFVNFSGEVGTVVPEPGTMLALGAGLAAIAARRRRKKS